MARKRESLTDIFFCAVCLEDYKESGALTPRLLPCSHTLCEACIKQTLGDNTLVCPVCRKKHWAINKVRSFPQNEYLLLHIQRQKYKRCQEHGQELALYCFDDTCQKPICISCLVEHNKHDIKGIQMVESEHLKRELKEVKNSLEAKLKIICEAKKYVDENSNECVTFLEKSRNKVVKCFDETINKAKNQRKRTDLQTDKTISVMKKNIEILTNIEEKIEGEDSKNWEADYHETVRGIIEDNKNDLSGARLFQFPFMLCEGDPSNLLYEDKSVSPREVCWLDLSGAQPKPAADKPVIHTELYDIKDMCFVQDGNKQLLIVAGGDLGLFAYNTETDKLEWKVSGLLAGNKEHIKTMGVTADERGHLFVTDLRNNCIQVFLVSDGKYLGHLVMTLNAEVPRHQSITREELFHLPCRIRWCKAKSSLVCSSGSPAKWHLTAISVEY